MISKEVRRYLAVLTCFCGSLLGHASTGKSAPRPLPMVFEANQGQLAATFPYRVRTGGVDTRFERDGWEMVAKGDERHAVHVKFSRARAVAPHGVGRLAGQTNYLIGNSPSRWVTGVALWSEVDYDELYPGISLAFYGNGQALEHDFRVAAGADPGLIAWRVEGNAGLQPQANGDLAVSTADGPMTLRRPVAYQEGPNGRQEVRAEFRVGKDGEVGFTLGAYDRSRALVIDPVIVFSTYLAGTGSDQISGMTTDQAGNVYVTGSTSSLDFPTKNPLQTVNGGGQSDAFVAELDATGKSLIFATYLGGSSDEASGDIRVDASGNILVTGVSRSTDFPHAGAIAPATCQGNNSCYYLASLQPGGSALTYAGVIGGSQGTYDAANGRLAVDAEGSAYVAGTTDDASFQVTAGTLAGAALGYPYNEMFVLKVDRAGHLVYSTLVPGNAPYDVSQQYGNYFRTTGLVVDSAGNVTATGTAGVGLPTTAGVVGPQFPNAYVNVGGASAGFLLQLNATGTAINFATYLPGTDQAGGLAVDGSGNFWIAGTSYETNLPVSAVAYQKKPSTAGSSGPQSGYVMEVAPRGASVVAATYLDGTGAGQQFESSSFSAIALDSKGTVFVGGETSSADFPLQDPFVTEWQYTTFNAEMVVAGLSPDLSRVTLGTFLNSTEAGGGSVFAALAVNMQDQVLVAGVTDSRTFPTTSDSFEPQVPGAPNPEGQVPHSFVAKIDLATPAPAICFASLDLNLGSVKAKSSATSTLNVTNCGDAPLTISEIASSDATVTVGGSCGTLAPGAVCPVQVVFAPVSSDATNGTLVFTDNAKTLPQSVSFTGQGIAPKLAVSANPIAFDHLLVGTTGPTYTVYVGNGGSPGEELSISSVTVTGAGFTLIGENCAGDSNSVPCQVQLAFTPTAAGALTGALVLQSNDPVTPVFRVALNGTGDALYGVPTISGIDTPSVPIGGSDVLENLTGANFYPSSVAKLNGVALPTTFKSNTSLSVTLPAGAITVLGEEYLTVVNPQPGGGVSASVTVTPFQSLPLGAAALVSVPATGRLYAAIQANIPTNANTVVPIDPTSGTTEAAIAVGANPQILSAAGDGSYLYVANQTAATVQRINLQTKAVERTFAYLPDPQCSSCEVVSATDLLAVPGQPQEVLLAQGGTLALFNDAGLVNYVPNDGICCYADPNFGSIAIAGTGPNVYGLPFTTDGGFFQTAGLTGAGLTYTRPAEVNQGGNSSTGSEVISDGKLLYTSAGEIWDPSTRLQVGTFPVTTINATSYPNLRSLAIDSNLGQLYVLGTEIMPESLPTVLSVYSLQSHALSGALSFTQFGPETSSLVRWGKDGFAFLAPGGDSAGGIVVLVRSSVTSPVTLNPTPVLTSIAPMSALAGGADLVLTVNGSGFVATSVVEWNGAALKTTFASSQQLTAVVPASLLAQAGTVQVAVYSPAPGGGSSAPLAFTVTAPVGVATLSASTLTFADTAVGVASAGQTLTLTNSGDGVLNLTGATATGDFGVMSACGAQLAPGATCKLTVVFTPTAAGPRSGVLSLGDNAKDSPQKVTLSGNGTAALAVVSPVALSFASTAESVASAAQTLVLTNPGNLPLTITGVTTTGDFAATNDCGAKLAAGASCNVSVVFTPTAAGARTGTLSFADGAANSPQTVALSGMGVAAITVGSAQGGSASNEVNAGGTASYSLSLTGGPGFAGMTTLSCAGAPQYATCSVTPSTVTLAAGGTVNFSVAVTTSTTETARLAERSRMSFAGISATSLLGLCWFGRRRRRLATWGALGWMLVVVVCGLSGCGGGGAPKSTTSYTPAGTYTLTITATSGSQAASEALTLVVK